MQGSSPLPDAICPLNLPAADLRVRLSTRGHEIYDRLRRKWLVLTPEEWVRQNFVEYLHSSFGYPTALMANEVSIRLNGTLKRCDTVIYDRSAKPLVIVEYKAPEIAITQKVFDQIARYNMTLNVPFLIVSNGRHHYCCRLDSLNKKYNFIREIPLYDDIAPGI